MVAVYAVGVCISFTLQRRVTFSRARVDQTAKAFRLFVGVAIVGALATWVLAVVFRYVLLSDRLFGNLGATAAFGLAALSASVPRYSLDAKIVFRSQSVARTG